MDQRKIIHIDMDAFYASVEQRDFPELKGKPVAVGGGMLAALFVWPVMKFISGALGIRKLWVRAPLLLPPT